MYSYWDDADADNGSTSEPLPLTQDLPPIPVVPRTTDPNTWNRFLKQTVDLASKMIDPLESCVLNMRNCTQDCPNSNYTGMVQKKCTSCIFGTASCRSYEPYFAFLAPIGWFDPIPFTNDSDIYRFYCFMQKQFHNIDIHPDDLTPLQKSQLKQIDWGAAEMIQKHTPSRTKISLVWFLRKWWWVILLVVLGGIWAAWYHQKR